MILGENLFCKKFFLFLILFKVHFEIPSKEIFFCTCNHLNPINSVVVEEDALTITIKKISISLPTLQRQNAENFKQIFPEKEIRGLSLNFHIHVSVSELYIPTMGLPFL